MNKLKQFSDATYNALQYVALKAKVYLTGFMFNDAILEGRIA